MAGSKLFGPPPSVPTQCAGTILVDLAHDIMAQAARVRRIVTIMMKVRVRSERLLMDLLDYNLLFRWFVGSGWTNRCGDTLAQVSSGSVRGSRFRLALFILMR